MAALLLLAAAIVGPASAADCTLGTDFKFDLTPCDSHGGRWRVQVPTWTGTLQGCQLKEPTRINSCESSCKAGQYFNLSSLSCSGCQPGSYSLGGAVLFDNWDTLPEGFHTQVESFQSSFIGRYGSSVNCSLYGWQAKGEFLASLGGPCAATVTLAVRLAHAGNLSYTYQYGNRDVIFDFEAQNEQCQSVADAKEYRWPPTTTEGEWRRQVVLLKAGNNLLQWKTIGMETYPGKPVLIRAIEISGMPLTSYCSPCRNGTYSSGGSRQCLECSENHFSTRGSSECKPCNPETEFSPKGYPRCLKRHICSARDYFEARSPCDAQNQTQTIYRWLDPKICVSGVRLPQPGPKHPCLPCNPGMSQAAGGAACEFCPLNHISEAGGDCKKCPPNTTPNYGYMLERWAEMPPMVSSACRQQDGSECGGSSGWQLAGTHIHSGRHHADGAYLLLSLNVPGFRGKGGVVGGRRLEVGRVSFTFELDCKGKCEFVFMQASDRREVTLVQSWEGAVPRHEFSHPVYANESYTFSWAFQKASLSDFDILSNLLESDVARIFSINVTNTIDGGASVCLPCHEETEDLGCIPCPAGHYVEPNTTQCSPCPRGTTVSDPLAYGRESCQPCGPGLTSTDGVSCITNCKIPGDPAFDLSEIAHTYSIRGSHLFTASGAQYFHLFNISLCGKAPAQCFNNVSYQMDGQNSQIKSFVCRTTMVPSLWADEEVVLSTQSVTLGDELVAVTKATTFMHMEVIDEFLAYNSSLHFYYSTPMATRSCPQGRTTVISLSCDPSKRGNGTINLPSKCPDGTCDGCNFNFLWQTPVACPICNDKDFKLVKGECTQGTQMLHYLAPTNCRVTSGLPATKTIQCQTHIPVELKALIGGTVAVATLLCGLMVHFWRKTQRLEYKYMKLVQGSSMGSDTVELPPAESCALDDGEEEDVHFAQPPTKSLFNRIKAMTSKVRRKMTAVPLKRYSLQNDDTG